MTPEAMEHAIRNLEAQLQSFERMACRNLAERQERDDRVHQIKRDIERIRGGHQRVGLMTNYGG
jgi:hypothetical protein